MENIKEEDIIDAIIALDGQKIEDIRKSLRRQLKELYARSTKCQKVISILSAAGHHNHEEYAKQCALVDSISKEIESLQGLMEQCNCVLKELNK